jgi:hypothetical protein
VIRLPAPLYYSVLQFHHPEIIKGSGISRSLQRLRYDLGDPPFESLQKQDDFPSQNIRTGSRAHPTTIQGVSGPARGKAAGA